MQNNLSMVSQRRGVARERFLVDPRLGGGAAKRVLVSDSPDDFRPAFGKVGQKILKLLAGGPMYPAEIARELGVHHQTVYYHMKRLQKAGLVSPLKTRVVRGGEATVFSLSSDGYAVEYPVRGELIPSLQSSSRSRALGVFLKEFVSTGSLDGWVVVGSPVPHGAGGAQARDGHYAVQLGFALGQFVSLPQRFPVKLDVDIKAEKLEASNMLVVGGPRANLISEELNRHVPIRFSQSGFWGSITDQDGRSYGSELDSLVAKIQNPWDRTKTCVLAAGVTGAGTKAAIIGMTNYADQVFRGYSGGDFACVLRGVDRDGDGKVDFVEIMKRAG
jgi:DNA-binding transcriptional ArsR family regulator